MIATASRRIPCSTWLNLAEYESKPTTLMSNRSTAKAV